MIRLIAITLMGLVLVACTDNTRPESTGLNNTQQTGKDVQKMAANYNANQTNPNQKVICTDEAPVGSHIKEVRCHTMQELEDQRNSAKRLLETPRTFPTKGQ